MLIPRGYLTGRVTQAEMAREFGVSLRQMQRIEEVALARFTVRLCRELRRLLDDTSTGGTP